MRTNFSRFCACVVAGVWVGVTVACSPVEVHQVPAIVSAGGAEPRAVEASIDTPESTLLPTAEAPADWPVYTLATELPASPAQLRLYMQVHPAPLPGVDQLAPLLEQLRITGRPSMHTSEAGNPEAWFEGEQGTVRISSLDPPTFTLQTNAGMPTSGEPQVIVPSDTRAAIAEAFLDERGLLDFAYRLEPPTLSPIGHRAIRVVPLIDGVPLNDYNALNGRLMLIFNETDVSYVSWLPLKLTAHGMAGVIPAAQAWDELVSGQTPTRQAPGQCWQALVFGPDDPLGAAVPIGDERCVSYSAGPIKPFMAATIDKAELVYFARDLSQGASFDAYPADSPARLVFPMWQFAGATNDERSLEVLWPAMEAP